jgi:hypothetical protein
VTRQRHHLAETRVRAQVTSVFLWFVTARRMSSRLHLNRQRWVQWQSAVQTHWLL